MRTLAAATAALAVTALLAGTATGERTSRSDLSDPDTDASQPQLAANSAGTAVATWRERRGRDWIVRVAVHPRGSGWTPARDVSLPGGIAEGLDVAVGDDGTAAAAWHRAVGARTVVQVAVRAAGGTWGPPETLSDPAQSAYGPRVTVSPAGAVTAVWSRSDGRNAIVQSASHAPGGAWTPVSDLSEPGRSAFDPQVDVDDAGNAVALWRRSDGSFSLVQAAERPAGGAWGAPATLSTPGGNALTARLAVTGGGRAVAIWRRFNGSEWVIQTAERPAGGAWEAPEDRSRGAKTVLAPRLVEGESGIVMAIWTNQDGLWTARRTPDGFGAQRRLAYGDVDDALAIDPSGGIVLVRGGFGSVSGEFRMPGDEDFRDSQELSPCFDEESDDCFAAFSSRVVAVGKGEAVALWLHSRTNHDVVQTADFDSTVPPPPPDDPIDEGDEGDQGSASLDMARGIVALGPRGLLRVPVRCGAAGPCAGAVTVRAMVAARSSAGYAREASRPGVQASARVRLGAGGHGVAVLHGSAALRAAVASAGSVRALVTLRVRTAHRVVVQRRVITVARPGLR